MLKRLAWLVCVGGCCVAASASAASRADDDDEPKPWAEAPLSLPASSKPVRPIKIDLGPTAENIFSVDAASLAVVADGVVRFMVSITSPAGAITVAYEGIRCASRERRSYAYGRSDGTWSPARNDRWVRIEPKAINAYPNVLYREYFCPDGLAIRDVAEARMALERGGHPAANGLR